MYLASCTVTSGGRALNLSPTEFKILQCFIASPNCIIARENILEYVWGTKKASCHVRTIDMHINRLRTALKKAEVNFEDSAPSILQTVRFVGYCLRQQNALDLRWEKRQNISHHLP
jgi:DNA-binding response OmpR family regulator